MHAEQIKAAIRMAGTTPAAIAAQLKVSPSTVGHVIHGRGTSARVELAISKVTGLAVSVMWPDRTNPKRNSLKRKGKAAAHV